MREEFFICEKYDEVRRKAHEHARRKQIDTGR
jgi:hypothetical protein